MEAVRHEIFKDALDGILNTLYDSQHEHIDEAAQIVADCIQKDGVVHVFGTGHSVGLGIDIRGRVGSLVPIHIMQMSDFVTKGIIPFEEFSNPKDIFERRSGVAEAFIDLYDVRKQDCFIIISNSGINGIVIDLAQIARERGHKVIVVTSMLHTMSESSRHPSGKKLYEFGDIVIDNCGPIGDALLESEGIERVCSVSSICGNCIAQSMAAKTCALLVEKDIELPVLKDAQLCEEHSRFNERLMKHYDGRVSYE